MSFVSANTSVTAQKSKSRSTFAWNWATHTQRIQTKGSRRKFNAKKAIAHDDVTHGAMARKILKKIIELATRIE